jgi:hypothetical protein
MARFCLSLVLWLMIIGLIWLLAPLQSVVADPAAYSAADSWSFVNVGPTPEPGGMKTIDTGLFAAGSGSFKRDETERRDAFGFVHKQVTGPFEMLVRIDGPITGPGGSGAGPMIRGALEADAPFGGLRVRNVQDGKTGRTHLSTGRRLKGAGFPHRTGGPKEGDYPVWFRVQRYGDKMLAHYAWGTKEKPKPKEWTITHLPLRFQAELPKTVYAGVAVDSNNNAKLAKARFGHLEIRPLKRKHETSWLGNTYGGGFVHVTAGLWAVAVDSESGKLTTNGPDEYHSAGIYNVQGEFEHFGEDTHFADGTASAVDERYVYHARERGEGWIGVYLHDGSHAEGRDKLLTKDDLVGGDQATEDALISSLAVDKQRRWLYACDAGNGRIYVIDTDNPNRPVLASFELDNARALTLGQDGNLWITQQATFTGGGAGSPVMHFWRGGDNSEKQSAFLKQAGWSEKYDHLDIPAKVVKVTPKGRVLKQFDPGKAIDQPILTRGLAVHPETGELWLADAGPQERIHIYSPGGELQGHFGGMKGIRGTHDQTKPGETHPKKFDHPTDLAFDNQGNLYLTCTGPASRGLHGGGVLRKFGPDEQLIWKREGLEFTSAGDAAPSDPSRIYTNAHTYEVDHDAAPGQGWQHVATHFNRMASPDDPRQTGFGGASKVVEIEGQRFLYLVPQTSGALHIYRFEGLQTAYCGRFFTRDGRVALWLDQDGDQRVEEPEISLGPKVMTWHPARLMTVDEAGGVWSQGGGKLYRYEVNGIADGGYPRYAHDNRMRTPVPSPFPNNKALRRVDYDISEDVLYASGFTQEHPDDENYHWKAAGAELVRIEDWRARAYSAQQQAPGRLDRADWSVHANPAGKARQAIDGKGGTSWQGGSPQKRGNYFQIDFGQVRKVNRLRLGDPHLDDRYPRQFAIGVSRNGNAWRSVRQVSSGGDFFEDGTLEVSFDPVKARYLRIAIAREANAKWHIYEANAYWDKPGQQNSNPTWRIVPIENPATTKHISHNMQAFDKAAKYLFVANNSIYLDVFKARDGSFVTRMPKGPEIAGNSGILDIQQGVNAFQRDNGQYIIIVEDNYEQKNLIFRWRPSSDSTASVKK